MTGTYYKLPDETTLQRGYTFTIMPDGRMLRVPSMSRLQVRAESESHKEDGDHDMIQALQDILRGKKPVPGRARMNRRGQAQGNRVAEGGGVAEYRHGQGVRPLRQHEPARPVGGQPVYDVGPVMVI